MSRWKKLFSFLSLLCCMAMVSLPTQAISINVGETYTCNMGYISNFKECVWTSSDYQCMDFVGSVSRYSTEVTVVALAKPTYAVPVTIHCQYYYYDLDPTTGRYTYLRSGYKDFQFFIKEKEVEAQSVSVYPSNLTLTVGDAYSLSATVSPSDASQSVEWTSGVSSVASVSSTGRVLALSPGNTFVRATTPNGKTASCFVVVESCEPTDIQMTNKTINLPAGKSKKLGYSFIPSKASSIVTWSSDDSNVASVNSSGLVTANNPGTAHITIQTNNGLSDICTVTVPPLPESVSLPSDITLSLRASQQLTIKMFPSDAAVSVNWESSNTEVTTVSQTGFVTACGVGQATITATTGNGLEAKCQVYVPMPEYKMIVWTKDGEKTIYDFAEKPRLTIKDNYFVMTTDYISIRYRAVDFLKFTLEDSCVEGEPIDEKKPGDVDGNGDIDFTDVTDLVNYINGLSPLDFDEQSADVNEDGNIDILDVTRIIELITHKDNE